ncbi:MAG: oxidoreductase family protein [Flavobacteriales bacterium]
MNPNFRHHLLKITSASECKELELIQSLWSGYGNISRYGLVNGTHETVVVKHIALGKTKVHPRGWNSSNSHNRKVRSYEVETHWYEHWNKRCNAACKTPKFLGSYSVENNRWIILEDLDKVFPLRKTQVTFSEVKNCLSWLAHFHAEFLDESPAGLWPVGTYWHLETRPDELERIEHEELKSKAHHLDMALNDCTYKTLVHGDAKLANFCFSEDGRKVAAVDFQYVGGGCGIKDVAYFLGSCLSSSECELFEEELLKYYFSELRIAVELRTDGLDISALENEWRELYPVACTDFMRFMLGWMPSHQKVNNYNLKMMKAVLNKIEL